MTTSPKPNGTPESPELPELPELPTSVSIWIWCKGGVKAYYCIGYYTKASLVARVKRDYGYNGTAYDCFHGCIVDRQLIPKPTNDGERVTYLEVR